jgi:tetratricopeptide (TPR) repeat protein
MTDLQDAIENYLKEPNYPESNLELARQYRKIGQSASAVSFYIRAAEKTTDKSSIYEALVEAADCFFTQGSRRYTVEGLLQYAITIDSSQSEAYLNIALLYEKQERWRECLLYATLGKQVSENTSKTSPNEFDLLIANSQWHIGLTEQARFTAFLLSKTNERARQLLDKFGYPDILPYRGEQDLSSYRFPFPGIETVKHNYSKHLQDMFVLSVLNGKRNGTYLELGSGDPYYTNNTALLETVFDWKGLSIDNDKDSCYQFSKRRRNPVICADATSIDYKALLDESCFPTEIDYLQIDCDEVSLDILKLIPFDSYKFSVIQFEHDSYRFGNHIKSESRRILSNAGYTLLVNDVAYDLWNSYEDWWVRSDLVKSSMKTDSKINFVYDYAINRLN